MSVVVFPFKEEDPIVVARNIEVAAGHPRVSEVWGVAPESGSTLEELKEPSERIAAATGTSVRLMVEQRLGGFRPGKGDAINTAIKLAADQSVDRLHFYDADITNFSAAWIDGAEAAADRGFGVVRHRYPRASTDAMITWMITRPCLAMTFPGTVLPRISQPLGGEVLLSGEVLQSLARNPLVTDRSDWGIDTVITYAITCADAGLYEHHIAEGKRHSLYGPLSQLREMVVECFDAVRSLRDQPAPPDRVRFEAAEDAPVPPALKATIGYDVEATVRLLLADWTAEEENLAATLPELAAGGVLRNRSEPSFTFLDSEAWYETLGDLLERFEPGNPVWESLLFRLWVARVLAYTTTEALGGYDRAIPYLEQTIATYEGRSRPR